MYNYSHTTYNRCTHEYKSILNTVSNYKEGNDMGGYILMITLAMPPNNITILAICTVLCMCAGGRGVCKLVHHHMPNTKLTQRDDNITCTRKYRHASSQYFEACKGLIHLCVTMTIHTALAQKHFSPETKSKVRPKKYSPIHTRMHAHKQVHNYVCSESL